jgi:hypothetical protein
LYPEQIPTDGIINQDDKDHAQFIKHSRRPACFENAGIISDHGTLGGIGSVGRFLATLISMKSSLRTTLAFIIRPFRRTRGRLWRGVECVGTQRTVVTDLPLESPRKDGRARGSTHR